MEEFVLLLDTEEADELLHVSAKEKDKLLAVAKKTSTTSMRTISLTMQRRPNRQLFMHRCVDNIVAALPYQRNVEMRTRPGAALFRRAYQV